MGYRTSLPVSMFLLFNPKIKGRREMERKKEKKKGEGLKMCSTFNFKRWSPGVCTCLITSSFPALKNSLHCGLRILSAVMTLDARLFSALVVAGIEEQ